MDPHFDGLIFQTHANELHRRLQREFPAWFLIDVRPGEDWAGGHLPGAHSVASVGLDEGLPDGTDAGTEFFVVGAGPADNRLRPVSQALLEHGARRVVEFSGGVAEWIAFDLDLDRQG